MVLAEIVRWFKETNLATGKKKNNRLNQWAKEHSQFDRGRKSDC
jgi:hypothetical protein